MTTGRINQVTSAVRIGSHAYESSSPNKQNDYSNQRDSQHVYTNKVIVSDSPSVPPHSTQHHQSLGTKYTRLNTARVDVKFTQPTNTNCVLAENISQTYTKLTVYSTSNHTVYTNLCLTPIFQKSRPSFLRPASRTLSAPSRQY